MFNVKYLTTQNVQMLTGAISKLLYGFASVWAIIHSPIQVITGLYSRTDAQTIQYLTLIRIMFVHVRIQRGDRGSGPPPPGKYKNIGFLSNAGPDSLKITKATKPAFNVGPSSARKRNAI